MNTKHKLEVVGLSVQQMAAKTMINSVAWQKAKAKRNKAQERGLESLKAKLDKCAHIVSAAAKGINQYEDIFEHAVVTLLDEVTSINASGVSDTPEELLAPAKK